MAVQDDFVKNLAKQALAGPKFSTNEYDLPTYTKGSVRVEWENLDEGWNGEYDPDDPDDQNLLRFAIYKKDKDGKWEALDNGTWCTFFYEGVEEGKLKAALKHIMSHVYDSVVEYGECSCASLSHVNPKDF